MKNLTFLLFLFLANVGYSQITLPIDFETTPVTADFIDFDGGTASVIPNPQSSGINTSASVAQIVRDGGQPWGGSKLVLANNLDFTTNNSFSMKVFSPAVGIPVLFKLEGPGAATPDNVVETTVANEWETLTWNYTGLPSNTYNELVFIFNLGTVGNGTASSTFLFDDIEFFDRTGGLAQMNLPVTFDETATVFYELLDFEGAGPSAVVVDPTDPTNMVAQVLKSNTAGTSAGTTMGFSGFSSPIPFTASATTMSVRVWSPDAGIPVRLKVEKDDDPTISVETETNTTVAMAWDTLVFDFSNEATGTAQLNLANTYNQASIFFNFGTDGAAAGNKTYFWDDVTFGGISVVEEGITLPVDFESTTINYTFGDFGGGVLSLLANPDASGINTSANVAQMVKGAGEVFGGSVIELQDPIDFSTNKTFKMKVWAPAVGTKVLLKVENIANGGIFFEQEVLTTTAMAWEEMTFDFSAINVAESYQKVVLIFENGTVGDGSAAFTYYVDDIDLVAGTTMGSGITLPVDFESTTINYTFGDFGGGVLSLLANPDASGINTSANVAQMVKGAGEVFGGSVIEIESPIDFSTNKTFKMKVWAPAVGTKVLLKVENLTNGGIFFEQEVLTTTAMAWEEMTFDFSAINAAESYQKVVLIFENGTMGDGSAAFTYYVDDIELVSGTALKEILSAAESGIIVSPNPASEVFNIEFPEALNEPVNIMLFDLNGKLVKEFKTGDQTISVQVQDLNTGIYFLRMDTNEVSYFQKVVIGK